MISRRSFLQVGSAGGAGLLVGFNILACDSKSKTKKVDDVQASVPVPDKPTGPQFDLNAWVRIGSDDTVTLIVSESEMGQGVLTSVAMILAEELEADWSRVRSIHAPADADKYGARQGTGGSTSIRKGYDNFRRAGAIARDMLIAAAAKDWGVEASVCRAENGRVIYKKKSMSFGSLAQKASQLEPPSKPKLKDPKDFKIIGKAIDRLDIPSKTDGSAKFGMDVQLPGLLVAQVEHPAFGGKVKTFDATAAKKVSGVVDVVEIPTGVAVVAEHYWAAKKGRDALKVSWDGGEWADLSTEKITAMCKDMVKKGTQARKDGDAERVIKNAKHKLSAVYQAPYLAHATMEPLNCTADVKKDSCELWVGTQSPSSTKSRAKKITGLDDDKIVVNTMMLGGGFGRRSQSDFVADAVHTSKAVGKPVKVIWTREDDTRAGQYRPMSYAELSGALDADGWPVAWIHRLASPSILATMGMNMPVDPTSSDGAADLPYAIANVFVSCAAPKLPVPVWFWRSVGSSQNTFASECFFDELVALGKRDPLEARLHLLKDDARHKKVLEVVAEKAGWGSRLPAGRARGIAVRKSFGTFVAEVAEVSIDKGDVRVHRVTVAVDPGQVINPDTIEAQMQSSIAYGLTAALHSHLEIKNGRTVQANFDTYPIVRMHEMPRVDVHIVPSGDKHGGVGEPGLPPLAPAVCNGIFALTKKPIRTLPIKLG